MLSRSRPPTRPFFACSRPSQVGDFAGLVCVTQAGLDAFAAHRLERESLPEWMETSDGFMGFRQLTYFGEILVESAASCMQGPAALSTDDALGGAVSGLCPCCLSPPSQAVFPVFCLRLAWPTNFLKPWAALCSQRTSVWLSRPTRP
eukprot:SAG22_NODE_9596_length_580_cov_1.484407_1_plen_146_part_10